MSNIYKGEFQDYEGNVVYPHTSADVVFATDGQTIQKKLNDAEIDYTDVKAQLTSGEHEFRFGVTADGEFGYHKEVEGADTVIPFSKSIDTSNEPYYQDSQHLALFNGSSNSHISGSKTITYTATKSGMAICYCDKTGQVTNKSGQTVLGEEYTMLVNDVVKTTNTNRVYIFPIKKGDIISYTVKVDGNSTGGAAAYFYGTIFMYVY